MQKIILILELNYSNLDAEIDGRRKTSKVTFVFEGAITPSSFEISSQDNMHMLCKVKEEHNITDGRSDE